MLQLNGAALQGLCYNSVFSESEVELHFSEWTTGTGSPADKQEVQLFQNQPNPFEGYTRIGFLLPQPCDVHLRVFDSSGRALAEYRGHYPAGKHDQILNLNGASGVLYYELITPFGILAKKMTAR